MDVWRFHQRHNPIARSQVKFFARLLGQQSGEWKAAVEVNPHHWAFATEGPDSCRKVIAWTARTVGALEEHDILGMDTEE